MRYPQFFDRVEALRLYDPLAKFLGAVEDGVMEITYLDLVKFAGHSCPTIAGVYLMARMGLERLFDDLPMRGEIEVHVKGSKAEGVNGVVGNTLAYICGVSDEAGFKGIGGRFDRSGKLFYDAPIQGEVALKRSDTGAKVELRYDPSIVPPEPRMKELMQKLMMGEKEPEIQKEFGQLWQKRVEKILTSKDLWPKMVTIF